MRYSTSGICRSNYVNKWIFTSESRGNGGQNMSPYDVGPPWYRSRLPFQMITSYEVWLVRCQYRWREDIIPVCQQFKEGHPSALLQSDTDHLMLYIIKVLFLVWWEMVWKTGNGINYGIPCLVPSVSSLIYTWHKCSTTSVGSHLAPYMTYIHSQVGLYLYY